MDVDAFITNRRWRFAKTMPQWPHEYTVRNWDPDEDAFEEMVRWIRDHGEVRKWYPNPAKAFHYNHTYLDHDGWQYWTMGNPVAETTVINRARL